MKPYPEKTSIKYWSEADRPREKLLLKGKAALSDAELIAILMGSGNTEESAVDLAKRILGDVQNNLIELSRLSVSELSKYKGIGEAKALSIVAALELGQRRRGAEVVNRKKIECSADAYNIFLMHVSDAVYEQFMMILLNRANDVLRTLNISEGGMSGTIADPKKIFKLALENNASAIILGHNHPSDNLRPSDPDIKLTRKIKEAGILLEIDVLDHIILGSEKYYSFADEGMM